MFVSTRRKSNNFYVILIAGAAALGGFLFGYDTAVSNRAFPKKSFSVRARSLVV